MQSQFLQAALAVLEKAHRPMSPKEIIEWAIREGFLSDSRAGKTPRRTLNSKLSMHILQRGDDSTFVRTGPGLFDLRRLVGQEIYHAPRRLPQPSKERVLVFPSAWLDGHERFQGISQSSSVLATNLLSSAHCSFMDRMQAEQSEDCKQILTYIMVTRRGQLLAYKRGTYNRVEDFLRGSQCVGFGGHVSNDDFNLLDAEHMGVFTCAARELAEELKLPDEDAARIRYGAGLELVGLLNDDSSPTGRRHFAFIFRYEVSDAPEWDTIRPSELSITQLRWLDPSAATFSLWDFEYWSQLCLREFYAEAISVHPFYRLRGRGNFRPPQLLCVLGEVGSGKSEATRVLRDEFGYSEINTGVVLAKLMGIPPVTEETRTGFQERAWQFITAREGPKRLAEAIWADVHTLSSKTILIDGIRQQATLDEIKKLAGSWYVDLLYIHAPPDVAYSFYRNRDAALTIHDFLKVRDAPVEREVGTMLTACDAVLYNWTGRVGFHETIRNLMAEASRKELKRT